jgi:hypothetical protein
MPINEFFHVACATGRFEVMPTTLELDRSCLDLPQYGEHPTKEDFKNLLKEYFPEGLSHFGKDYLMERVRYERVDNYGYISQVMSIDAYFEFVRRLRFPGQPSRYQSFFAWESLDEARTFNNFKAQGKGEIFLVTAAKNARLDANWLNIGQFYVEGIYFAEQCWRGLPSDKPAWEYLLGFPVTVIERVE